MNINTTIDLRLLDYTGEGQKQIFNQVRNLPGNLGATAKQLRPDRFLLDTGLLLSDLAGADNIKTSLQNQKNTTYFLLQFVEH